MKKVLTIAGSDSGGGAGIQADIKTITANGCFAMSAITALTAQNTLGVSGIYEVSPEFLGKQIDAVFSDLRPHSVKIGMISSAELIETVAEKLLFYKAENIVTDPVMVATSGSKLIKTDAISSLVKKLFPISTIVTPNIPEAEVISGERIYGFDDMKRAAKIIGDEFNCAVLVKGGHGKSEAIDVLYKKGTYSIFAAKRINNPNTHGTGCTLSSAIAANLARCYSIPCSVYRAKKYLSGALKDMLNLGEGCGPVNHGFDIKSKFFV